jgi:hypothetical protein
MSDSRISERDIAKQPRMPCPGCGKPVDQDWLDATLSTDLPERFYVKSRWACHTSGCPYGPPEAKVAGE